MKKLLLPLLVAIVLPSCTSREPAPVINVNQREVTYPTAVSSTNAGWQTNNSQVDLGYTQPPTVPTPPTYNQPTFTNQPLYNQEVEPIKMETKTVTEKVKVKKKVVKKTPEPKNVNIPRDASNKPVYNKIDKGFYDSDVYTVRKGDTMYLIAYISGKDVNEIARLNNMKEPYQLSVGQKIKLSNGKTEYVEVEKTITKQVQVPVEPQVTYTQGANGTVYSSQGEITGPVKARAGSAVEATTHTSGQIVASAGSVSNVPTAPTANTVQATTSNAVRATTANTIPEPTTIEQSPTASASEVKWQWPATGRIISKFSSAEGGNQGIDIAGSKGQDVRAAASGTVVYTGNSVRGYGNLVIIKHTDDFLSAYAHNDSIKVKEQDKVKAGDKIATMGNSDTDSTKLHFEIRYKGKSVDPTRYLPRR